MRTSEWYSFTLSITRPTRLVKDPTRLVLRPRRAAVGAVGEEGEEEVEQQQRADRRRRGRVALGVVPQRHELGGALRVAELDRRLRQDRPHEDGDLLHLVARARHVVIRDVGRRRARAVAQRARRVEALRPQSDPRLLVGAEPRAVELLALQQQVAPWPAELPVRADAPRPVDRHGSPASRRRRAPASPSVQQPATQPPSSSTSQGRMGLWHAPPPSSSSSDRASTAESSSAGVTGRPRPRRGAAPALAGGEEEDGGYDVGGERRGGGRRGAASFL